jgi:hypothetical protein
MRSALIIATIIRPNAMDLCPRKAVHRRNRRYATALILNKKLVLPERIELSTSPLPMVMTSQRFRAIWAALPSKLPSNCQI